MRVGGRPALGFGWISSTQGLAKPTANSRDCFDGGAGPSLHKVRPALFRDFGSVAAGYAEQHVEDVDPQGHPLPFVGFGDAEDGGDARARLLVAELDPVLPVMCTYTGSGTRLRAFHETAVPSQPKSSGPPFFSSGSKSVTVTAFTLP